MVGPFHETTFALFYDRSEESVGKWNLDWDTGPDWRITDIVGDDVRIFKFMPGEAGEIRVFLVEKSLEFEARPIPVFGAAEMLTASNGAAFTAIPPICSNSTCGSHACTDPTKPDLRCPGGNKECYKA